MAKKRVGEPHMAGDFRGNRTHRVAMTTSLVALTWWLCFFSLVVGQQTTTEGEAAAGGASKPEIYPRIEPGRPVLVGRLDDTVETQESQELVNLVAFPVPVEGGKRYVHVDVNYDGRISREEVEQLLRSTIMTGKIPPVVEQDLRALAHRGNSASFITGEPLDYGKTLRMSARAKFIAAPLVLGRPASIPMVPAYSAQEKMADQTSAEQVAQQNAQGRPLPEPRASRRQLETYAKREYFNQLPSVGAPRKETDDETGPVQHKKRDADLNGITTLREVAEFLASPAMEGRWSTQISGSLPLTGRDFQSLELGARLKILSKVEIAAIRKSGFSEEQRQRVDARLRAMDLSHPDFDKVVISVQFYIIMRGDGPMKYNNPYVEARYPTPEFSYNSESLKTLEAVPELKRKEGESMEEAAARKVFASLSVLHFDDKEHGSKYIDMDFNADGVLSREELAKVYFSLPLLNYAYFTPAQRLDLWRRINNDLVDPGSLTRLKKLMRTPVVVVLKGAREENASPGNSDDGVLREYMQTRDADQDGMVTVGEMVMFRDAAGLGQ